MLSYVLIIISALLNSFTLPGTLVDTPQQAEARPDASTLAPIKVTVVELQTGTPVTKFRYQFGYDSPGRRVKPDYKKWTDVISADGTMTLQAPRSCQVELHVESADSIRFGQKPTTFDIKSADLARSIRVELPRGITVKGVVRDEKTKAPIPGATVTPFIRTIPIPSEDRERSVKTDAEGRYEIRAVDPELGVTASAPDYSNFLDLPFDKKPTDPVHDILLKRDPVLTVPVTILDDGGKPLDGVTTVNGGQDQISSLKDGKLVVRLIGLSWSVTFHRDGFIDRKIDFDEFKNEINKPEGLVVVMERAYTLVGTVVAPDGQPVKAFSVVACPVKSPYSWDLVKREIEAPDGRFRLDLQQKGETWVGVRAPGFASWEASVNLTRDTAPLEARLAPGVTVTARILAPPARLQGIQATLQPRRDRSDLDGFSRGEFACEFAAVEARPGSDGSLYFDHVRPDRYEFMFEGKGIPKTRQVLDLADANLDLGTFHFDPPTRFGRIEGRFWKKKDAEGGPWAFAKGYVGGYRGIIGSDDSEPSLPFQADENGRFKVENVPEGRTAVGVPWQFFDVVGAYTWTAQVVAGQTTVIRGFEPGEPRKLILAFAVGDGSLPHYESGTGLGAARKVDNVTVSMDLDFMVGRTDVKESPPKPRQPLFRVELIPLSKAPLAFDSDDEFHEIGGERRVVLHDVGAGTYRLLVHDWLGMRGLEGGTLFEKEIVVAEGARGPVTVSLGAGCITGKVPPPGEDFKRPVEVTAVARGSRGPVTRVRCDGDGNFCVRYLGPGTYTLFINDPNAGYCLVDDVVVSNRVVDVGERTFKPGATVTGSIRFDRPSQPPDAVVATDSRGVTVTRKLETLSSFDSIKLNGLYPGRWTVQARAGETPLAAAELDITGEEPKTLTLHVAGTPKP